VCKKQFAVLIYRKVRSEIDALREGRTLNSLAGRPGGVYVPGSKIINIPVLNRFCANNPKIGRVILRLAEKNRIAMRIQAPLTRRKGLVTSPAIIKASHSIVAEIAMAVPRHLPADLRDDAIQNIWLAVIEGRLKRSEIASRAPEFIRAEYKNSPHNAWGPRSLDVPIWIDSNTTLIETVTRGLWD